MTDSITEKWLKRIKKAEKKLKEKHRECAEKAEKHYYNDESKKIELPIYWSSTQVQRSALYAQPPAPEIRGRNNDVTNPLSKAISKVLEEAISYQIDQTDFHGDAKRAVLDFIVTDLGVCRMRYKVKTGTEEIDGQPYEVIADQKVHIDHWPWKRFIYDIGKDWAECDWICYIHYMKPAEVKSQYNHTVKKSHLGGNNAEEREGKVVVYEVWDKKKREVIEFYEHKKTPLRTRPDPLRLKDFFDCPKPLVANMRSDKYIPQSDFKQIERQLEIINRLEERIDKLTESIKVRGLFDSAITGLDKVATAPDNKYYPVDGLLALLQGNNFDNVIATLPIMEQAQVLSILEQQKKEAKEQIYEITGLSDIVRGNTKATETATAQQIKGQWASVRLQDKQSTINTWLRSIMRLYAEVIAEHFEPQQLELMTGEQISPEMMQTMQSDVLRCYAIDVETDSTIQADESQDRQDRMEMVNTLLPMLQTILPAVQQSMLPLEMGKNILLTAVRGFKYTRQLEDMINGMGDNMQQLQELQGQLQEMQQKGEQMEMAFTQQLQQAQSTIQQLQGQLNDVNMQEEQRKNIEVQAEAGKDQAEIKKKEAETAQIWQNIAQTTTVAQDPYQASF